MAAGLALVPLPRGSLPGKRDRRQEIDIRQVQTGGACARSEQGNEREVVRASGKSLEKSALKKRSQAESLLQPTPPSSSLPSHLLFGTSLPCHWLVRLSVLWMYGERASCQRSKRTCARVSGERWREESESSRFLSSSTLRPIRGQETTPSDD